MEKKKRIIFSAGGTGGHLLPALKLADELKEQADVVFISGGTLNRLSLEQSSFPFHQISCSPLSLRRPFQLIKALMKIARGTLSSLRLLSQYKPDLIIGFGSYFTFPLLVAARIKRIPLILHEQNALPGKVNRLFAPYAVRTAITFPEAKKRLRGKSELVHFPLKASHTDKKTSCFEYFGLSDKKGPVLLVYGGSSGAHILNLWMLKLLPLLKRRLGEFQVIHCVGYQEDLSKIKAHYVSAHVPACIRPFEPHMEKALSIADLAFTRAGSGTINELIEAAVPAVLIPYPHASENHQEMNAKHFTNFVQGGKYFVQNSVTETQLLAAFEEMIDHSKEIKEKIRDYRSTLPKKTMKTLVLNHMQGNCNEA